MKTLLLIWSLVLGQCHAGPFFFGQQGQLVVIPPPPLDLPAPLALSVTCQQYLRGDSLADAGGADGDSVATWSDEANSYDATQATASAKPTLKLAVYNGHACVRFDAVDDNLTHSSFTSAACWMVIRGTSWNGVISYISSAGNHGYFADYPFGSNTGPGMFDGTSIRNSNSSNRIATGSLRTLLITPTNVYIDGVEVSGYANTGTPSSISPTRLNGRASDGTFMSAFDLVEIAHFSSVPTAGDLADLQAWAETEYGAP